MVPEHSSGGSACQLSIAHCLRMSGTACNSKYYRFVSLRRALRTVISDLERWLYKLPPASAVAAECDVGPAVMCHLCDSSLLERLGLKAAEQEVC